MVTSDGVLAGIGLSDLDESVYRLILSQRGGTASSLSTASGLTTSVIKRSLERLQRMALVTRAPDGSYTATPPEAAIELQIVHRQRQLEEAREAALVLGDVFRRTRSSPEPLELIEVVTGREEVALRWQQLATTARSLRLLDKPPYAVVPGSVDATTITQINVPIRTIIGPESVAIPGRLGSLESATDINEQIRFGHVPIKLVIADDSAAMLPLRVDGSGVESAVVVHESSLLDALIALFEVLWSLSAPFDPNTRAPAADAGLAQEEIDVVTLLAGGLKDTSIARALGISRRTVERRVSNILGTLHAETRFQAGVAARDRGLLGER